MPTVSIKSYFDWNTNKKYNAKWQYGIEYDDLWVSYSGNIQLFASLREIQYSSILGRL